MPDLFLGAKPKTGENYMVPDAAHLITMAPAGSGKSTALLVPNLLQWSNSAFVMDPKGELFWLTGAHRAKPKSQGGLGQKVYLLDPFGEVERSWRSRLPALYPEPLPTHAMNPLDALRFDDRDPISGGDDYHDDVSGLIDAIVERSNERDPYWKDSAAQLLRGVITEGFMHEERLLSKARDKICWSYEDLHDAVIYRAVNGPASYSKRQLGRFSILGRVLADDPTKPGSFKVVTAGSDENREMLSVHSSAINETNFLDSPRLLRSLEGTDRIAKFGMDELASSLEPVTIYVVLPPDKFESPFGRKWLRLIVQTALNTVMRARPKEKVLFALDEFGTIGRMGEIESAFGVARGQGLCLWAFVQNLGQLKRDYEKNYQTFMANASASTFFNLNDPETAGYLEAAIGKRLATRPDSASIDHEGRITHQEAQELRPRKRADEITRAGGDTIFVLERGKQAAIATAVFYQNHPLWLSWCREDPYHPRKPAPTTVPPKPTRWRFRPF